RGDLRKSNEARKVNIHTTSSPRSTAPERVSCRKGLKTKASARNTRDQTTSRVRRAWMATIIAPANTTQFNNPRLETATSNRAAVNTVAIQNHFVTAMNIRTSLQVRF